METPTTLPATPVRRRCLQALTAAAAPVVAIIVATATAADVVAPEAAAAATRQDLELSLTAAGFDYGKYVGTADYAVAAREFGIPVGDRIDGSDIDQVVATAWAGSVERFATAGIGIGAAPDVSDFTDAAVRFGIDVGSELSREDAERILAVGRARVAEALAAAGIDYGTALDASDIVRAGKAFGIKVGTRLDPQDTRAVVDAAWLRVDAPLLATAAGVRVHAPSPRPAYVGFHQSSSGSATPMNATQGRKLPSRGRGTAGTSAVDVAMDAGDPVRAPVTGTVVEVQPYSLYGKYPDYRIRFRPDDNPRMLVTAIHVTDPEVRPGQHVRGGADVIAGGARKFPFVSQIDVNGGGERGHVHLEMRPR